MNSTHSVMVPVTTLDRVLSGRFLGEPLLIKIDVEGHEYDVLLGAHDTLMRPNATWIIEHGLTENFETINPHFHDLFDIFWQNGYEAHSLAPSRLVSHSDIERWLQQGKRDFGSINFLFVKPNI